MLDQIKQRKISELQQYKNKLEEIIRKLEKTIRVLETNVKIQKKILDDFKPDFRFNRMTKESKRVLESKKSHYKEVLREYNRIAKPLKHYTEKRNLLEETIKKINNATTLKDLEDTGIDIQAEFQYLKDTGIEITFSHNDSITEEDLKRYSFLCEDSKAMQFAVSREPSLIMYDKTNDVPVYVLFIDKMIKSIDSECKKIETAFAKHEQGEQLTLEEDSIYNQINRHAIKNDILVFFNSLKPVLEKAKSNLIIEEKNCPHDKYLIPKKYLMDAIKHFDTTFLGDYEVDSEQLMIRLSQPNPIEEYNKANLFFQRELGEELQRLYEDPNVLLGVAGSRAHKGKLYSSQQEFLEDVESYFENGLYNGLFGKLNRRTIGNVVMLQETEETHLKVDFCKFLNYSYAGGAINTILAIPRDSVFYREGAIATPIWRKVNEERNAIDRRYIYGAFNTNNPDMGILHNPHYNEKSREGTYYYNYTIDPYGQKSFTESIIQRSNYN